MHVRRFEFVWAFTKKWIKLPRFCSTYQAVDFILKYATKIGCDNTGTPISVKNKTNLKRQLTINVHSFRYLINVLAKEYAKIVFWTCQRDKLDSYYLINLIITSKGQDYKPKTILL